MIAYIRTIPVRMRISAGAIRVAIEIWFNLEGYFVRQGILAFDIVDWITRKDREQ